MEYPIVETTLLVVTFFCLLMINNYVNQLKVQKDDLRMMLFIRLSGRNSTTFQHYSFFFLKYIHVFVLLIIFIIGIEDINIFYIGIMFLFIIFAPSSRTYRKSGKLLLIYVSLFIYFTYFYEFLRKTPFIESNEIVKTILYLFSFNTYVNGTAVGSNFFLNSNKFIF